jgi:AraC family transcriptional regulator of adaptative response/methylated-DNA-[protein]-cysteine methyltransferase
MKTRQRPSETEMYDALLRRDPCYEGVFVVGVNTTGVFCRPTCPARKPRRDNVAFFPSSRDALAAGFRPCKRCRPLEPHGSPPEWLRPLLEAVEADPGRRWRDFDLRERGLDPARVRRWFLAQHEVTFHAYQRARRLGAALGRIRLGADLTEAAFDAGYESVSAFRDAFAKRFGSTPGSSRGSRPLEVTRLLTPLGPMVAGAVDEGLCLLEFADRRMLETQVRRVSARLGAQPVPGTHPHLDGIDRELREYFAGKLKRFRTPRVLAGTPFQEAVWTGLLAIPHGETRSYDALARSLGRPGAQRAVGRANGDNRIAVVVPCHRVVRSDGSLCGYGGGLWRKQALLDLEQDAGTRRTDAGAAPLGTAPDDEDADGI